MKKEIELVLKQYRCQLRNFRAKKETFFEPKRKQNKSTLKLFPYRQLRDDVARFAGVLSEQGVGKGDRVLIYMPMIPQVEIHISSKILLLLLLLLLLVLF